MPVLRPLACIAVTALAAGPLTVGGGSASAVMTASAPAAAAAGRVLHVSTTGSDSGTGTATRPFRTVQRGVDAARAGDTVSIHAGTYNGIVRVTRSGAATAPITITAAGDGPATLTASFGTRPCDAHAPALDRTVQFSGGVDHVTLSDLTIVGGVTIKGLGAGAAMSYLTRLVNTDDWQTRRQVPGRGANDPAAASSAFAYLAEKTGKRIDPSDGLRIVGNTITGRGVQVIASRYGEISGNEIGPIDCGTGPGVWINVYSDGWTVAGNHIHDIAASTHKHYMQEGIRLGSASSYNVVTGNLVEHLPGDGRAMNTDVDASWNTFRGNTANDVAIGYNDQMSGWGNVWDHNVATDFRVWGINLRGLDSALTLPSLDSSPYLAVVTCNTAVGGPTDPAIGGSLRIGAAKSSTFANNTLTTAVLGSPADGQTWVRSYWAAEGNTWDGKPRPPRFRPPAPAPEVC